MGVNSSKVPEGAGVFEYRGDDEDGRLMYDGEWKNKAAHGYGVMRWQNGDRYEGDWSDGLRQGKGKYTSKSTGGKYDGQYKNEKYEGKWEAGLKEGEGKFTYASGDVFTGPYVAGNRHGMGELVKADGEVRSENYEEGKLVNFIITKEKNA